MQPVYVRDFTEQTGPAVPVPSSPLQVFRLFFTPAILEYIVTETNRYARLDMGEERYRKWDIITTEDLVAYFGIMIVMGMVRLPHGCLFYFIKISACNDVIKLVMKF